MIPSDVQIADAVEEVVGHRPIALRQVDRGYTAAARRVVSFPDGTRAFVKMATNSNTQGWLRAEHHVYAGVEEPFLPKLLGWRDGEAPVLVLEDLSEAVWPPPWSQKRVDLLLDALDLVAATTPPAGLPRLADMRADISGWAVVADEPERFLPLGLGDAAWLAEALPTLVEAENEAPLDGESLVHLDVRSDNLCFPKDRGRCILVDWNWACVGNPAADSSAWLPSAWMEGALDVGVVPRGDPRIVACFAGYWARMAGGPELRPGSTVRDLQRRQLASVLPWLCGELDIPTP